MDFSMKLNDNKAGLDGLDKDRINAIIQEASKNSLYSKHQEKRASRIKERIKQQQDAISKLTPEQIRLSEAEVDRLAKQLEENRDLSRTIVHIDMDAYYAAVEMRDNPSLREKPMAVGGMSMLSTSNYIARRFGVRAGMAGYIGKKLCPQLVIAPLNFRKYIAISEQVRLIMAEYDPNFMAIGLDEATLDITDYLQSRKSKCGNDGLKKTHLRRRYAGDCVCKLPRYVESIDAGKCDSEQCDKCGKERLIITDEVSFGHSLEDVTNELRFRIEQETGLTASAGISVNKMLAKVCTDIQKPNGQYFLPPVYETIMDFVRRLPIRKVSGIGGVTESMLKAVGVETCGDLYEKRGLLALIHSPISSRWFLRVALGLGSSMFDSGSFSDSDRKSIGVERTFSEISDPDELTGVCRKLCEKAVEHMNKEDLKAKTVTLKMKTVEFDVKTRATTLDSFVCDIDSIFNAAKTALFAEIAVSKKLRLRLMGIRLSSFLHETEAYRLKVPEITRYLRQSASSNDASSSSPTKYSSKKFLSADEDSMDSTCSGTAMGNYSTEDDDDEIIVINDDYAAATTSAAPGSSAVTFSNDVMQTENPDAFEDAEYDSVVCPICNCKFTQLASSNRFNAHLDQCLNRKAISDLIKEQDRQLSDSRPSASAGIEKKKAGKRKGESPAKSGVQKKSGRSSTSAVSNSRRIEDFFKPL